MRGQDKLYDDDLSTDELFEILRKSKKLLARGVSFAEQQDRKNLIFTYALPSKLSASEIDQTLETIFSTRKKTTRRTRNLYLSRLSASFFDEKLKQIINTDIADKSPESQCSADIDTPVSKHYTISLTIRRRQVDEIIDFIIRMNCFSTLFFAVVFKKQSGNKPITFKINNSGNVEMTLSKAMMQWYVIHHIYPWIMRNQYHLHEERNKKFVLKIHLITQKRIEQQDNAYTKYFSVPTAYPATSLANSQELKRNSGTRGQWPHTINPPPPLVIPQQHSLNITNNPLRFLTESVVQHPEQPPHRQASRLLPPPPVKNPPQQYRVPQVTQTGDLSFLMLTPLPSPPSIPNPPAATERAAPPLEENTQLSLQSRPLPFFLSSLYKIQPECSAPLSQTHNTASFNYPPCCHRNLNPNLNGNHNPNPPPVDPCSSHPNLNSNTYPRNNHTGLLLPINRQSNPFYRPSNNSLSLFSFSDEEQKQRQESIEEHPTKRRKLSFF